MELQDTDEFYLKVLLKFDTLEKHASSLLVQGLGMGRILFSKKILFTYLVQGCDVRSMITRGRCWFVPLIQTLTSRHTKYCVTDMKRNYHE